MTSSKILLSATALVMGVAAVSMPAAAGQRDHNGYRNGSGHVAAGDIRDRTDVRQARQASRIQQGIRSGELTPREVAKLREQQDQIRDLERRAERDGHISRSERARIEAAQDRASRAIRAEKHDAQDRSHGYGKRRWFDRWGKGDDGYGRRFGHNDHDHGKKRWYRRWF